VSGAPGVIDTADFPAAMQGGAMPDEGMEQEGPKALRLVAFIDAPNIAEIIARDDKTKLATIGAKVVKEYEIDKRSRADWETRTKKAMDLAMQVVEEKSFPWAKAANVKYPLMTSAAIQYAARAYPAIVTDRGIVKGKVIGYDQGIPLMGPDGQPMVDPESGEPLWQIPPGVKQQRADRIAQHMSYQLLDEMKSWEEDTDRLLHVQPIVGTVFRKTYFDPAKGNCSELVMADDLVVNYHAKPSETPPRMTQHVRLYPYQITERKRDGRFLEDFEPGLAPGQDGDDEAPHLFLEQHRLLDLDEDGYPEPYCVTVHKETAQVVRIVARFDQEGVQLNDRDEVIRVDAVDYFTKYGFIPAPDGSYYDVGFGHLLNPINETVNTVLNQLLDAGTLANTGGGFIGRGLKLKGGPITFRPGEWKPVDAPGGTIKDNMVPLVFPGPSPVLFELLGMLVEAGREVASVKDVLTGDTGEKGAMTATTTLALIEQGLKVFTSIYKRVHRSLKNELDKLYRLNRIYMSPEQYQNVLDVPPDILQQLQGDYAAGDVDVIPVSDPSVVTDMQKLGRAQFLTEMMMNGNPFLNGKEVTLRALKAANVEDAEMLVVDPPPQPDPKVMAIEAKAKTDQMKAETDIAVAEKKLEIEETKAVTELQIKQTEAELDMQIAQQKAEQDFAIQQAQVSQQMAHAEDSHKQGLEQSEQVGEAKIEQMKKQAAAKPKAKE
jgi:chaperonin GroES